MPHRLASAVTALFLALQFVLLGSGFSCVMPATGERGMTAMAAMAAMAGMEQTETAPAARAPASGDEDGSAPWVPPDCRAMAPCAQAAVASTILAALPSPLVPHEMTPLVMLAPSSLSTPPDLPPPRA